MVLCLSSNDKNNYQGEGLRMQNEELENPSKLREVEDMKA